jgi:hypothetical protein
MENVLPEWPTHTECELAGKTFSVDGRGDFDIRKEVN